MPVALIKTRDLLDELQTFIALLRRCVGPAGRLHLLASTNCQPKVTSLSSRLLPELQQTTPHPILAFLLQAAQAQIQRFQDGGLWTCICTGLLLDSVVRDSTPAIIHDLCSHGLNILSHPAVRVEVSLDSVRPLLSIASSILKSKPYAFGSACSDVPTVALAVVKGFIETAGTVENLVVQGRTGLGEPRVFPGMLWSSSGHELDLVHGGSWENVSVVLVSRMLTDVKDPLEKVANDVEIIAEARKKLEAACRLVNLLAKSGIRVLACQRVVHDQVALSAHRSGILVLPRLGRQLAARLERLSGAKPIREDPVDVTADLLVRSRGRLTNVRHEMVAGRDFLVLGGDICTLLLHAPTSDCSAELTAVVNQALAALSCAVSDSAVLPGAGCIEVWLCAQLWKKVVADRQPGVSTGKELSALRSVQLSLLSAAGMDVRGGTFSVDSEIHHAWDCSDPHCIEINPGTRCRCGLVDSASLGAGVQWTLVNQLGAEAHIGMWNRLSVEMRLQFPRSQCDLVLDTLSAKRNAFKVAIETASTLAHVGATLL